MINRFFHFTIVLLLGSCFVQAQANAPQPESGNPAHARKAPELGTGKWWISLTDEARDRFVERYTKAMDHVMSDLVTECNQGMKSLLAGGMRPPSGVDEVDIFSSWTFCKIASSFDFSFGTHKELREGADEFYKDPANLTVPIDIALPRVRDALAAKHPRGRPGFGSVVPNSR